MGIFSRSRNTQTSTVNNYDQRSIVDTTDNSNIENSGEFAGVSGTINMDSPEAWQFGDGALRTVEETTNRGYDSFTRSLASINESNNSLIAGMTASLASGGQSDVAAYGSEATRVSGDNNKIMLAAAALLAVALIAVKGR